MCLCWALYIKDSSKCFTCINFNTYNIWIRHTLLFLLEEESEAQKNLFCSSHIGSEWWSWDMNPGFLAQDPVLLSPIHYVYCLKLVKKTNKPGLAIHFICGVGCGGGYSLFANSVFRYYSSIFWNATVFLCQQLLLIITVIIVAVFYKMAAVYQSLCWVFLPRFSSG